MGYANVIPYQEIALRTGIKVQITQFTTVGSDPEVGSIVIPQFSFPLSAAYLDVIVQRTQNDDVAVNFLTTSGSFGIMDSTDTTYTAAANISGNTLYVVGGSFWDNHYIIPGTIDIKAAIEPGHTQKVRFDNAISTKNGLNVLGMYAELRLYFGMG